MYFYRKGQVDDLMMVTENAELLEEAAKGSGAVPHLRYRTNALAPIFKSASTHTLGNWGVCFRGANRF
jgi:hypothetical protein